MSGFTAFGTRRRPVPARRVHGRGVEPNRGHAPRTVRGNDLLLKPIRQSISGCRSTREDVHLRPQSRWFEGEFDGKIQRSKVQDEVDGGAGGRATAAAGGGAGGRAAAAGCGGGLRVGAG